LFIENILSVTFEDKKLFSPVISLGSPENNELVFLKIIARLMFRLFLFKTNISYRVAIHPCDLEKPASVGFFSGIIKKFDQHKFQPVLMKEMK